MDEVAAKDGLVDACFHLGNGSKCGNLEIRMALRAMEKNFLDLGRVYVCGVKPPWMTGVVHLPIKDIHGRNKDANLINKVAAACEAGISERFIRSSDDEMILAPCYVADLLPYHAGDMAKFGAGFWSSPWKERLKRTMKMLKQRGMPTLHYDTHLPKVYQRESFLQVSANTPYQNDGGFCIDSMYLNQIGLVDPPRLSGEKLTLERGLRDVTEIHKRLEGKKYLGYNDGGLTGALKQVLQEMFPEPSRFEQNAKGYVQGLTFEDTAPMPMVVAVLGSPRSGTSCVAGIVHHLGVSMGKYLKPPSRINPKGFYEARSLRTICEATRDPHRVRTRKLRQWARRRGTDGAIGAKYGKLCNYVAEMKSAWPDIKVIAVDRPMPETVESMAKSGLYRHGDRAKMEAWATRCRTNRDRDLVKFDLPTLRLPYLETLADPAGAVDKIITFLGITPTPAQRDSAIAFVDPDLQHEVAAT